jgi:HlyD family secretion protein
MNDTNLEPSAPATDRPATPATTKLPKGSGSGRPRGVGRRIRTMLLMLLVVVAVGGTLRFTVFRPPAVSVAEVTRGSMVAEVAGTGTVTAEVLPKISSKITGRVENVFVNEGDLIRQDQIVATLDQTDLRRQVDKAQAQLALAQETADQLQRDSNRRQILLAENSPGISPEIAQQFENRYVVAQKAIQAAEADLASAKYNLSLAQIPSLTSGIVIKRWVHPGESVIPGQVMFTVADTSLIYVSANLDQNFAGKLRKGQPAIVILRGRENQLLAGYVLRISPQANAATEETVAQAAFTVPPEDFQLGQWANVYIQVGEAKDALLVPRAALMPMDERMFVFVVGADDVLRREPVDVLADSPRRPIVAVAGNLRPQERVVLMPMGLAAGDTVRPRPQEKKLDMQSMP